MFRLALVVALIPACAGDSEPRKERPNPAPPTAADQGAPEPDRPTAPDEPTPDQPAPRPTVKPDPPKPVLAPRSPVIDGVAARRIAATTAEDGSGRKISVSSGDAIAVDLQFERIPGRALDPVLEIGGATYRHYRILPNNVMRFVVARPELAEAGEVVLRWGRDVRVVADQLKVAP